MDIITAAIIDAIVTYGVYYLIIGLATVAILNFFSGFNGSSHTFWIDLWFLVAWPLAWAAFIGRVFGLMLSGLSD